MSTITLELTDTSANEILTTKHLTNSISDESEDESIDSHISDMNNPSSKFYQLLHCYLQQLKLVFQSIIPDLKSFKKWQIYILILYATFNVVFSILDANSFIPRNQKRSLFKWTNDLYDGVPLWRRILLCLSGISAFTTVLNVVLVIHGKMSSYFWGILGAIVYGTYAFAFGYAGDAQLSLFFFLPMEFIGIYIWSKELDNKSTTRVKSLRVRGWLLVVVLSSILIVVFFYEIPWFSKYLTSKYTFEKGSVPHILDAITNGLSVTAQYLLIACYWEQYILWTFVNLMLIVMYSGFFKTNLDINLLLVWIMLTINSTCGLYTWYHRWRDSRHSSSIVNIKA